MTRMGRRVAVSMKSFSQRILLKFQDETMMIEIDEDYGCGRFLLNCG